MRIILLNGPPRSGKDTVAELIKNAHSTEVHLEKFARPMKMVMPLIYHTTKQHWDEHLDTAENKDKPCNELFGATPRQVQINFSENYMKPTHSPRIFGELLIRRVHSIMQNKTIQSVVISDSGFIEEAEQVVDEFGSENVELWNILRKDCDFKGDSRGYIDLAHRGVAMHTIPNNYELEDLAKLVIPLYRASTMPFDPKIHVDTAAFHTHRKEAKREVIDIWFNDWIPSKES